MENKNTSFLRVKKLSSSAQLPTKGSPQSAGWDLKAAHETVVPARGKAIIATDLSIAVPEGCYGRIAPRSGLSWKTHTDIGAGVIDMDYRGPVALLMFNHANTDLKVEAGDRVAQLILEKISYADMVEVDSLDDTERGEGGFGSTGK